MGASCDCRAALNESVSSILLSVIMVLTEKNKKCPHSDVGSDVSLSSRQVKKKMVTTNIPWIPSSVIGFEPPQYCILVFFDDARFD